MLRHLQFLVRLVIIAEVVDDVIDLLRWQYGFFDHAQRSELRSLVELGQALHSLVRIQTLPLLSAGHRLRKV